ncbi:MAG: ComF family protein [Bacteroidetes bacterium]|nr:ComF family protein [Bacteroidota bacterium]
MTSFGSKYLSSLLHLFYPHNCEGCGSALVSDVQFLCTRCIHRLPVTGFFNKAGNPVEKTFYGRLPVNHAAAVYYFTKASLLQHLLVQLKYKNNREAGYFLGRMLGHALANAERFAGVEVMIPLPLNPQKEFIRGYNQSALLCEGIREIWKKPVLINAVTRVRFTETQTHRNRLSRWQNMENVFAVTQPESLTHKHILLVDDVITTGATLEACGSSILEIPGTQLSVAAVGYTG